MRGKQLGFENFDVALLKNTAVNGVCGTTLSFRVAASISTVFLLPYSSSMAIDT